MAAKVEHQARCILRPGGGRCVGISEGPESGLMSGSLYWARTQVLTLLLGNLTPFLLRPDRSRPVRHAFATQDWHSPLQTLKCGSGCT